MRWREIPGRALWWMMQGLLALHDWLWALGNRWPFKAGIIAKEDESYERFNSEQTWLSYLERERWDVLDSLLARQRPTPAPPEPAGPQVPWETWRRV